MCHQILTIGRSTMNLNDLLDDCKEKFEQVLLLIESSENDPETEPFRSRYEANKLLSELKLRLTSATAAEKVSDEGENSGLPIIPAFFLNGIFSKLAFLP